MKPALFSIGGGRHATASGAAPSRKTHSAPPAPKPPSPYYLSRDGGFGAGGAECVFLEGAAPLAVA